MTLRRTPLRRSPMAKSRPKPSIPPSVRELLVARSGGMCEAQLSGCTGLATDAAHRIGRKMGGRPAGFDSVANTMHLCRTCHRWCHDRPVEAKDLGLMLDEHQDPTVEPVAYRGLGFVVLDDLGYLWPFGDAA